MHIYKKIAALILITFTALVAAGCSGISNSDARHALLAEVAIEAATARLIEKADDKIGRAKRIIKIARTAKGLTQFGAVVIMEDIEQEINKNIDWSALTASEAVLARALVKAVKAELALKIDSDIIPERSIMLLQLALDSIIEAASVYINNDSWGAPKGNPISL